MQKKKFDIYIYARVYEVKNKCLSKTRVSYKFGFVHSSLVIYLRKGCAKNKRKGKNNC